MAEGTVLVKQLFTVAVRYFIYAAFLCFVPCDLCLRGGHGRGYENSAGCGIVILSIYSPIRCLLFDSCLALVIVVVVVVVVVVLFCALCFTMDLSRRS